MPRPIEDVLRTIARRTARDANGCRIWQGPLEKKGYASIRCAGRMQKVHRIVYAAKHGPIPVGKCVLHECDNRACSEDTHLFLGSNADNIMDKCLKDRSGRKLTIAAVQEIKRMAGQGMSHSAIARIYGVNPSNISRAISGARWAHVRAGGV